MTMDTYKTDAFRSSVKKGMYSSEAVRNMDVQKSFNSYQITSQDANNFSLRHSMTNDDDNRSSNESLQSRLPKNVPAAARSMSRIRFANDRSVDHTIPNIKGMFALPSIRNNDALQMIHNYRTPNKYNFM